MMMMHYKTIDSQNVLNGQLRRVVTIKYSLMTGKFRNEWNNGPIRRTMPENAFYYNNWQNCRWSIIDGMG